jgi:hypothetical protein
VVTDAELERIADVTAEAIEMAATTAAAATTPR